MINKFNIILLMIINVIKKENLIKKLIFENRLKKNEIQKQMNKISN